MSSRLLASVALLAITGCQGGEGGPAALAPVTSPGAPPATCTKTCNSEYDSCMDRFSAVGTGPTTTPRSEDQVGNLGPNDVCPDQLKACLRRCN